MLPRDEMALKLDGHKRFDEVRESSFGRLAHRVGIEERKLCCWVREARDRALDAWRLESPHLSLSMREREHIEAHHRRVPLLADA